MKLPLHILTLALDAIKFLPRQLEAFEKLDRPWIWHIVTGVADNVGCTRWCAKVPPRLSRDGTEEWLLKNSRHPNIRIYRRQLWPGKVAMCQAAVSTIQEPCTLLQVDADEFWTAEQIEKICQIHEGGEIDRIRYFCRYFVGPEIVVSNEGFFGNKIGEWSRSWSFEPEMFFSSHEPPALNGCGRREMSREHSRSLGLVFDHFAYYYEDSVRFKERYYKYDGAVDGWKRLQAHDNFPCKLKPFMKWVDENAMVDKLE